MLTLKLKRIVAVCLILTLGFLLLSPRANVVSLAYVVLMPVFLLFLADDCIARWQKNSGRIPTVRLHVPDLFVILLFVFELLNSYVLHASLGGRLAADRLLVMFLVYLFGRFYLDTFQSLKILACGLAVYGLLAGLLVLFSSFRFLEYIGSYGFAAGEIVPLRYLFLPAGIMINDWAGILLAFLPFAFFTVFILRGKWKYAGIVVSSVITLAVMYTLSRGAWLALLVWGSLVSAILIYSRAVPLRKSAWAVGMFVLLVAAGSYPLREAAGGMAVVGRGSSQAQSVAGRLDRWRNCVEVIRAQPLTGIGNGGYALESMVIANRDGSSYTRRVNNVALQILLEKGFIGLALYSGVLFMMWRAGFAGLRRTRTGKERLQSLATALFAAGSVALLVREMTFTTLPEVPVCMYLFVCMTLMIVNAAVYEKGRLLS